MSDNKLRDKPLSYLIRGMMSLYSGRSLFPGLAHQYADEIDRRVPVHCVPTDGESRTMAADVRSGLMVLAEEHEADGVPQMRQLLDRLMRQLLDRIATSGGKHTPDEPGQWLVRGDYPDGVRWMVIDVADSLEWWRNFDRHGREIPVTLVLRLGD